MAVRRDTPKCRSALGVVERSDPRGAVRIALLARGLVLELNRLSDAQAAEPPAAARAVDDVIVILDVREEDSHVAVDVRRSHRAYAFGVVPRDRVATYPHSGSASHGRDARRSA